MAKFSRCSEHRKHFLNKLANSSASLKFRHNFSTTRCTRSSIAFVTVSWATRNFLTSGFNISSLTRNSRSVDGGGFGSTGLLKGRRRSSARPWGDEALDGAEEIGEPVRSGAGMGSFGEKLQREPVGSCEPAAAAGVVSDGDEWLWVA